MTLSEINRCFYALKLSSHCSVHLNLVCLAVICHKGCCHISIKHSAEGNCLQEALDLLLVCWPLPVPDDLLPLWIHCHPLLGVDVSKTFNLWDSELALFLPQSDVVFCQPINAKLSKITKLKLIATNCLGNLSPR